MASDDNRELHLEIAHVLFIDIVGYSKLLTNQQTALIVLLNELVLKTEQCRMAEAAGKLIRIPTGDGMALVFFTTPDAPVRCAIELAQADQHDPKIELRMGLHSGPVDQVSDVNARTNVAGAGINMAQRVMDCGDAGHILLSKRLADDLAQYGEWRGRLHDLGEVEVKHGTRIGLTNLCFDGIGNPALPEKLRRAAGATRRRRLLPVALLSAVLLVGGGSWLFLNRTETRLPDVASLPQKSIAVLPFENMSDDKGDAFFADGIQDDVLTSLGKIKDLTVIGRASVMTYRGAALAGKLREIGKTLGVAHVLQGSVRRSANRVVVNVQLVDTRDEHQLWSERYERTLTDALSLQGELAVEIARELSASLTPTEQRAVGTKPTENPDAYVLYLRARELETPYAPPDEDQEAALKLYQQAIDLDPKFALARARLSLRVTRLTQGQDAARVPKALAEAEEALRLQPNLGEGRLALALYYLFATRDLDRAVAELSRAAELSPNSAEVWNTRAHIYQRQGKLRERIAALQQAQTLDPRDVNNRAQLGTTFFWVRNWSEGVANQTRTRSMIPDPKPFPWGIANAEFRMSGVLDPLKKAIAESTLGGRPQDLEQLKLARFELAMLERDYPAAERYLRETSNEPVSGWHSKATREALLAVARGADPTLTERALVIAREEIEKRLSDDPADAARLHSELALIDAFRGRKEDAIRAGRRGIELEDDALDKNNASAALALIYARTGEADEAISLIEKLLTLPATIGTFSIFSMTQADLKWRWVWDPLRSDPRFQKILEGPEPKTIY